MKNIAELYTRLQVSENNTEEVFQKRYPEYQPNDGKVHILYIAPCLNGSGFYRMILPMLELNKTATHKAIISNLHKWNFFKQFEEYDNPIDKRLIEWANYIVFPPILMDASETFELFRQINPEVELMMDLDTNFHSYPKEHPNSTKITQQMKDNLLSNMAMMDLITGVSEELLNFYTNVYEKHFPQKEIYMEYLPNLISNYGFQKEATIKQNASKTIRIGLIGNISTYKDVLSIKDALAEIQVKHKDKIEIILFGWNGKLANGEEPLNNLSFDFVKSVSFLDYYRRLNELVFDFVLLPLEKSLFNVSGKSFIKYLELGAFAVPVIAAKLPPYVHAIEQEENGLLASNTKEWVAHIDKLIEDKDYRYAIGRSALKNTWRNFSYTTSNLERLKEVFIKN